MGQKGTWLFVAIFGGVGIVMLVVAVGAFIYTLNFRAGASVTEGVVVELAYRRGNKGGTLYAPVFEFADAQGTARRVESGSASNPASYDVGDRVTVRYDPDDPANARVDGFMDNWFMPVLFFGMGSVFAAIGIAIGMAELRKRQTRRWLASHGMRVQAQFTGVVLDTSVRVNGRSPWRLTAQWQHPVTAAIHTFESDPVWFDPSAFVGREELGVSVDADDPSRYVVDIAFLPKHA